MNIQGLEPFMPPGLQPTQPLQPGQALDNTQSAPANSFERALDKADGNAPLQVNQGGIQPGNSEVGTNPFVPDQGFSAGNQFDVDKVQTTQRPSQVQGVNNQQLSLDQLNTQSQSTTLMKGLDNLAAVTNQAIFEPEEIAINKDVAEFRRKKISNAYSKLSSYATRSGMIYA